MRKIFKVMILSIFSIFILTITSNAITPESNPSYRGIDVSEWQGYIDYEGVKNAGVEVVYIKASQGNSWKDPYFEINYENAKNNNLKIGFYHFLTATNEEEARLEARFFASVISGKQVDCKLAMDYETFQGASIDEINNISQTFIETLEDITGKEVVIYSDLYNASNVFGEDLASRYPLWLAYYGDYNNLNNVRANWNEWIGVQYFDKGLISRNFRICR